MELTKEQVQEVEKYLDLKNVNYIDFKIEIFDHLILQIEEQINNGRSFDSAFKFVKLKWNSQLKESNSWFFGVAFTAPKIVIKKAKKIYLPLHILLMSFTFLIFIIISNFNFKFVEFGLPIKILTAVLTIVSLVIWLAFKIDKKKTVYSFLIKPLSSGILFFPLVLLSSSFNSLIDILMLCFYPICVLYSVVFYQKHQKEKEKYKLLVK